MGDALLVLIVESIVFCIHFTHRGHAMKYCIFCVVPLLLAMGNPDTTDKLIVDKFCAFYACDRKQLLPHLRGSDGFLRFASVNDNRQRWEPILSDRHCVDMIRHNALPTHWNRQQAQQWLSDYVDVLLSIKLKYKGQ